MTISADIFVISYFKFYSFNYCLKRETILKMFYNKKYAFNRYNIVCKISNIRVKRKKNY